ncbi:MAG: PAS domain S-box protein [Dehalococcoidia bacterium]|nr:PAS domain S-box protein [Dehalococcoidia bacterium]
MKEEAIEKGRMLNLIGKMQEYLPDLDRLAGDLKALEIYMNELASIIYTFADVIDEGVVLVQENKIVWTNRAASEIAGYTQEEILKLNVEQSILPDYREKYKARNSMLLAGDKPNMPVEWQILRKDRTVRFVTVFAYKAQFFEKPAVLVIFYDITEDKKMRDELAMRAQILDSVSDAIMIMNSAGKIMAVNDSVSELTGYTRDELLTMNILKLALSEREYKFEIRLKQYSEHKEVRYKDICVRKDGVKVPVEIRGKIIKQGGQQFHLGVAREIVNVPDNNEVIKNGREGV